VPVTGTGGDSNLDIVKITDYAGNKIYENGQLKRVLVSGGYIENNVYHFYLTDHLGNNRVVINQTDSVVQRNHYSPFGMEFADNSGDDQPYKYNGKELDKMHGLNMYDYSARYMEPGIGRFTSVDPKAEKYYSISPYVYCLDNPLKYVDPRGDTVRVYTETEDWGHTWISVGEGDDMVIYSFNPATTKKGKRGKGEIEAFADGSLFVMKGEEAKAYNERKSKVKGGMHISVITDVTDEKMTEVVNDYIKNKTTLYRESEDGQKTTYKTNELYKAATNNCTTFASDMLNSAGSDALKSTGSITNRTHGEVYTVTISNRFILPSSLQNWLKKTLK